MTEFTLPQQIALGLSETHLTEVLSNGKTHQLHQQVKNDWQRLVTSAQDDGIDLTIASAYRSFERQRMIWNNKANGLRPVNDVNNQPLDVTTLNDDELLFRILHWSALPGGSRHHWGTDLDVYAPSMLAQSLQLEPWEYDAGGPMEQLGAWLTENLKEHGFFMPYQSYNGGVAREPWHISHIEQSQQYSDTLALALLEQCVERHEIGLKTQIQRNLAEIYQRYIINIVKSS